MSARTRIAVSTLTAALLTAGIALAGPASAAASYPSLDEVLYEGPVNELLMPVGDVLDVVDPSGVEEQEGENEALSAPAGQEPAAELATEPPARKKHPKS